VKPDHVIICRGYADGRDCPYEGMFLRDYDADARGGIGEVHWTSDLKRAKLFRRTQAMQTYLKQSWLHPVRITDGRPNRPLTAFNVEIVSKQLIQKEEEYGKST
jgi:hypothetical protein